MFHRHAFRMLCLGAVLAATASREVARPMLVRVRNAATNTYLTAEGNAQWVQFGNEPVRLRALDPNDPRQLWYIEPFNEDRDRQLLWNVLAGRVLEIDAQTRMATTNLRLPGVSPNQAFYFWLSDPVGLRGEFRFGSGCLDAYYANNAYGPEVGTWACHGRDNQAWILQAPK